LDTRSCQEPSQPARSTISLGESEKAVKGGEKEEWEWVGRMVNAAANAWERFHNLLWNGSVRLRRCCVVFVVQFWLECGENLGVKMGKIAQPAGAGWLR